MEFQSLTGLINQNPNFSAIHRELRGGGCPGNSAALREPCNAPHSAALWDQFVGERHFQELGLKRSSKSSSGECSPWLCIGKLKGKAAGVCFPSTADFPTAPSCSCPPENAEFEFSGPQEETTSRVIPESCRVWGSSHPKERFWISSLAKSCPDKLGPFS